MIFEKWLPYKKVKRPILLEKAPPLPPVKPTRNVIIEYEPLKAFTVRRVIEEGVFRVDPSQYSNYNPPQSDGNVRIVDRIDDLPPPSEEIMRVLQNYNQSNSFDQKTQRQDRVLSPEYRSTIFSPTIVPLHQSQTKQSSQNQTPRDTPIQSNARDV